MQIPELTSTIGSRIEAPKKDYTPVFMMDDITESKIDEDLIDDIQDSRDD